MDGSTSKEEDVRISIGEQQETQTSTPTKPSSSSSNADRNLINEIKKAEKTKKREVENDHDERSQIKIQKVPESILKKEIFKDYSIMPKVIAIGPFYVNRDKLTQKELKHRLAARFIRNSGEGGEILLLKFKKNFTSVELKKLFKEKVIKNNNEDKLIRMLFVDGCAILQFIDSYVNNDIKESDEISNIQANEICHDLFLVENQIPFKVLVVLMRLSEKGIEFAKSIYYFCSMNIMAPLIYCLPRLQRNIDRLPILPDQQRQLFKEDNNVPIHLLDLLRSELLFVDSKDNSSVNVDDDDKGTKIFLSRSSYKRSFRNVQDLKEVGIKLKPDYSIGLRSISFSSRLFTFGQLNLPPLIVDETTKQKLLNLVAYEMCLNKDYVVTSYLRLLDSLIDCEQDVKDLRSAYILKNNLGSDAQVAELFNSIGSILVTYDAYASVKNNIQKHYERKIATWNAQLCQEHLRNPWTTLGVLAALAGLLLTGIQAYYSIHPKKT
ncbi:hypothetical protein CsatB_015828 [Cannabis sativa]